MSSPNMPSCGWVKGWSGSPVWYTPNKAARGQDKNVARGLHPMGLALLLVSGATCGNCKFLKRVKFSRVYLKCAKARQSRGPATDVRAGWPACQCWESAEEKAP